MTPSKAVEVLREIRSSGSVMIVGPGRGKILVSLIREHKPKRVLEIGANVGYSAILMGKELGEDASLITIEINPDAAQRAEENIRRASIKPDVKVMVGDACEVLAGLQGSFDFVFIDAAKDQYMKYLQLIEDKLETGCVVVADNVRRHAHKMQDYLEHVRSSGHYDSRYEEPDYDAVEISIKR
jgi:predicted O-methyltransferase YrrM